MGRKHAALLSDLDRWWGTLYCLKSATRASECIGNFSAVLVRSSESTEQRSDPVVDAAQTNCFSSIDGRHGSHRHFRETVIEILPLLLLTFKPLYYYRVVTRNYHENQPTCEIGVGAFWRGNFIHSRQRGHVVVVGGVKCCERACERRFQRLEERVARLESREV